MAPTGLPATAGSGSTESPVLTFQTGPGSITSWHSCKAALMSSCHVGWLQPACQSGRRWSCIWEEMGGAVGSGGTLPKSAVWLGSTGQAAGPGAAFVACSHAALALALAFSPQANQISGNDYNQPHYPESRPRALPGQETHCPSIL